ncbi:GBS Bsp-like repeat-containing protein, partial [Enterococcus cecorum]|uniref:GBS Bsp-like repeat-containing protein n=1 Tax=Enterococcus cecorum TaxID=44008 RepID=UPI000B55AD49
MKKSKKWITFSVCAATLSLFLATNNFADETQTTNTTTSSTVIVSSSSSAPVAESTETSAVSTETTTTTTTTQSSSANSADEVAAQTTAQEVKPIEGTIKNVNQEKGTYDVVVKVNVEIESGIKEVKVPIWQRADQKDLKWYQAEKQNDGTWLVHMNIANHQYHRGVYTTHVYVYANDGSYEAVNLGETS